MANPWFRLYSEFASDHKMQMMSEAYQRRYVMLLCLRCSNGDVTLQDEEVAFQLRISSDEWSETKAVFIGKNLIDKHNKVLAWERRQFISDSSVERVRKHREKKKHDGNVTVTPPDTEQNRADSEQNREEKKARVARTIARPDDVDEAIWDDWVQLRKNKRATVSKTVIDGARIEAKKAGMEFNAFLREWVMRGSQGLKAEWLVGKTPQKTEHQKRQDATTRAIFGENPFLSTIKTIEGEVIRDTENFTRQLGR